MGTGLVTKPKTSHTLWLMASSTGNIWIRWLTTIYCCSVRGKRGLLRWKREWCWTRAGGRISRGWKLSLQHLESAELQAADREKNLGGGGFSVEVVNSLEHGVKAAKWRERDTSGACLRFKIFWCIHLHYMIFSSCIFGIFYNHSLSQPSKSR